MSSTLCSKDVSISAAGRLKNNRKTMAQVQIEHWDVANAITDLVPDVVMKKVISQKPNSFEVTVNGELIFSKLAEGKFPNPSEIAEMVKKIVCGGKR
ncbi:hypothetical protein JOB18_042830 [Solea senegalensis]|uniref:Selenoprotein n=1 Tax=Solea senegalensis TaxID=28829 RepID=A0AAV6Q823_SOLSE|nr:hypothetical protein JOB18_042830 [Solea senegalensis]